MSTLRYGSNGLIQDIEECNLKEVIYMKDELSTRLLLMRIYKNVAHSKLSLNEDFLLLFS
jgi:hypothetical protein